MAQNYAQNYASISARDLNGLDRTGIYRVAKANGFHLPSLKSSFVTIPYLCQVLLRETSCPLAVEIRLGTCNKAPPISLLVEATLTIQTKKNLNLGVK